MSSIYEKLEKAGVFGPGGEKLLGFDKGSGVSYGELTEETFTELRGAGEIFDERVKLIEVSKEHFLVQQDPGEFGPITLGRAVGGHIWKSPMGGTHFTNVNGILLIMEDVRGRPNFFEPDKSFVLQSGVGIYVKSGSFIKYGSKTSTPFHPRITHIEEVRFPTREEVINYLKTATI